MSETTETEEAERELIETEEAEEEVALEEEPDIKAASASPANPVHHCTGQGDGTDYTDWSYVYFGSYPQSEVTGDTLTADIIGAEGGNGGTGDSQNPGDTGNNPGGDNQNPGETGTKPGGDSSDPVESGNEDSQNPERKCSLPPN